MIDWRVMWVLYFLASFTFLGVIVTMKQESFVPWHYFIMHISCLGLIAYKDKVEKK